MEETDVPPARRGEHDPARGSASLIAWALLVILAIVSFAAAAWLYVDRDRALDDLDAARHRVGELRQVLVEAEGRIADLEEGLSDEREQANALGEEIVRCREALELIAAAWNDVVGALEAAGDLRPQEARSLADRANEQAREAERAAERCGRPPPG